MKETEALVRIQEIDLALMRSKSKLDNMPQAKKRLAVAAARKKLAGEISKIVGIRKDADMDLEENEASHRRAEEQVEEIQEKYASGEAGYRELADLESRLSTLAKRMEKLEFKHGDLVAKAEAAHKRENDALALDKKLQMEDEALLESLNQSTAQVRQGIRELLAERKEVCQYLSDDIMARYEAAARRFDGLAVETLRASQPSICRVTIPASSFGDIRRGPSITECPYCHRLLVTDGMFDLNA